MGRGAVHGRSGSGVDDAGPPQRTAFGCRCRPATVCPMPGVEPLPGLVTPSHVESDGQFIGCSMVERRSLAMFVAIQLFRARGFQRLRHRARTRLHGQPGLRRVSATHSLYELFCDSPAHEMGNGRAAVLRRC